MKVSRREVLNALERDDEFSVWRSLVNWCKEMILPAIRIRVERGVKIEKIPVIDPDTFERREMTLQEFRAEQEEKERERRRERENDEWWLRQYPDHNWRTLPRPNYPEKLRFTIELTESQVLGLRAMVHSFWDCRTPARYFAALVYRQIRKQCLEERAE